MAGGACVHRRQASRQADTCLASPVRPFTSPEFLSSLAEVAVESGEMDPSVPPSTDIRLSLSFAFYFSVVLRCSIIIAEEERNVFDASSSSSSFLPASSELLRGEIHPPCDQSRNCRRRRCLSRCQSEESTIMTNSRSVAFALSHMNDQTSAV